MTGRDILSPSVFPCFSAAHTPSPRGGICGQNQWPEELGDEHGRRNASSLRLIMGVPRLWEWSPGTTPEWVPAGQTPWPAAPPEGRTGQKS